MTAVGAALAAIILAAVLAAPVAAGERLVGRARVTDGDTLSVGGVAVRLKGLAAPEVPGAILASPAASRPRRSWSNWSRDRRWCAA